ncbi:M48 family metalloprotease [Caballeronia sp. DA-9]|uniref:M48 family metalloprotease n=1 Tax=Caballeronia sp. DA-9 TaxID=3436237 RepID=UPI003F675B75
MSRHLRFLSLLCALGALSVSAVAQGVSHGKGECQHQVLYQSDTDDASRYLEEQQRQIYTDNPKLTDPYSRAELDSPRSVATFAELKARALKACPNLFARTTCALDPVLVDKLVKSLSCIILPTRFEAPLFSSLISLYTRQLDSIRLAHFPKSLVTRFGSLPTGTFDAQAILPPRSKVPLVILNRDIFFFTGALSKSIADAIPITMGQSVGLDYSEEAIRQRLHDNPYIVHNFADAMSRLVRDGSSAGATEVTLDENHNHIHARLVGAMDLFLISHETSHVILGHVSDQAVQFRLAGSHSNQPTMRFMKPVAPTDPMLVHTVGGGADQPSTALKAEVRTREQEFQADALGFRLMIWSEEAGGDPVAVMMAGGAPQMVFRILDAASMYGSEAGGWTFQDANHPTAADRIAALSPVFAEVAKSSEPLREVDFRIPLDAAFKELLTEADLEIRKNLGLKPKNS